MNKKKKILFISYDANRNGASILLLRFLGGLSEIKKYEIFICLQYGGVLLPEFRTYGKAIVWNTPKKSFKNKRFGSLYTLLNRFKYFLNRMIVKMVSKRVDIVFNNTINNYSIIEKINLKQSCLVTYIHESELGASYFIRENDLINLLNLSNRLLVVSDFVLRFYKKSFPFIENKIFKIDSLITYKREYNKSHAGDGFFRIGLCGGIHPVKGFDLLPGIISSLKKLTNLSDVKFVWVGANSSTLEYRFLKRDLRIMGITDFVEFISPCDDTSVFLKDMDIFLLPSREDSFPLVVLEAASCGLPIICFKDAGGASEFVSDDAGILVDYLDLEGMAKAILYLKTSSEMRLKLGKRAFEKCQRFMDKERIIKDLISYIELKK